MVVKAGIGIAKAGWGIVKNVIKPKKVSDTIINLKDHPIENIEYKNYCFETLREKSVLILENFLN